MSDKQQERSLPFWKLKPPDGRFSPMPLLRIKSLPNLNSWDERPLDPERLAQKWFDEQSHERPSLYEATTQEEEAEAVAAFSLTNLARRIEVSYIVRIEWDDLSQIGIRANNAQPGSTGVVAVDFRHWEIPGVRQPIFNLLRYIWDRVRRGEDRLRWIGKEIQRASMERFLETDTRFVIEEAKRCCRLKLTGGTGRRRLGPAIRDELRATPPYIPEGRIRSLAEQNWLDRLSVGIAGNAEQDWLSAEQELRRRYEEQFLGYIPTCKSGLVSEPA
jgi:hypothetical protein